MEGNENFGWLNFLLVFHQANVMLRFSPPKSSPPLQGFVPESTSIYQSDQVGYSKQC